MSAAERERRIALPFVRNPSGEKNQSLFDQYTPRAMGIESGDGSCLVRNV